MVGPDGREDSFHISVLSYHTPFVSLPSLPFEGEQHLIQSVSCTGRDWQKKPDNFKDLAMVLLFFPLYKCEHVFFYQRIMAISFL